MSLAIVAVLAVLLLIAGAAYVSFPQGPQISMAGENLLISSQAPFTVPEQQMSEFKEDAGELTVSTDGSAVCRYAIRSWNDGEVLIPEYHLFSPYLSGNDCLCPKGMYKNSRWEIVIMGQLHQPDLLSGTLWSAAGDKCLQTNCYVTGLINHGSMESVSRDGKIDFELDVAVGLGNASYSLKLADDELMDSAGPVSVSMALPECPERQLVVYHGQVKNWDDVKYLPNKVKKAKSDMRYRVEHRDEVIAEYNKLISSQVPGCRVSGNYVVCKQPIGPVLELLLVH
jgi:hypothetical protein